MLMMLMITSSILIEEVDECTAWQLFLYPVVFFYWFIITLFYIYFLLMLLGIYGVSIKMQYSLQK